ncbi:MAG: amidase [SAR324 cluster bacterium]|jgi:amidase|nr:amidase [SAR324 cluster bacterium]HCP33206.1 amidase [Deltaproteobacteria bacterium]MDP6248718.1 amidase [SAR324 cluster bacterium]MDP6464659.1 amidase [SAR324 cluster bacterium]MDP7140081.1 amidase [SAR324 cluster bacterium]|tara:strand:+ start:745 stop:2397 length:1653 start_codon:yes stop_codon:yes gene_type:complete
MRLIKLVAAIFGLVIIGVVALIIIDVSPYFGMLSSEDPVPQTYQAPSEANITLRSDIVFLSASEMAKKIREGALTSVEVVEGHLSQIYAFNPQVNAVVTVDAEGALERANKADQAFQKGKLWGPLHGVPFTVKDHFSTQSIRTTSGFGPLADMVPENDSTVVARLKEAGAILLGKTNMPPLATCCGTTNLIFGRTNNPWDLNRTVGGSSGGSAAALATGMTPIEVGSDQGGSIRIPAHYNGIFGLKPSEHLISFYGALMPGMDSLIPKMQELHTARHLIHLGPMTRSIEDLQLLLPILAGPDPKDVDAIDIPILFPKPKPLKKLKIAWLKGLPGQFVGQSTDKISMASSKVLNNFVEKLEAASIPLEQRKLSSEYMNRARMTWGSLVSMEYDFFAPALLRIVESVTGNPYAVFPYSYEKYQYLLTDRDRLISHMDEYMANFDALLLPVTLDAAHEHLESKFENGMLANLMENITIDGQEVMVAVAELSYPILFNLTGNPVVVIPAGFTESGLPVGIQVVGQRWRDAELLVVAKQLFEIAGDFQHPPDYKQ